jgi:hypothetical protein
MYSDIEKKIKCLCSIPIYVVTKSYQAASAYVCRCLFCNTQYSTVYIVYICMYTAKMDLLPTFCRFCERLLCKIHFWFFYSCDGRVIIGDAAESASCQTQP